jgi:glycosyltransferase involved in cell wall biosynthesis
MKKASIFSPYLDTLGGGERYTMAIATTFKSAGYKVDIQWPDFKIKKKLEDRFGINLKDINFVPDIKRGDRYDVCFWVSDGSIPTLRSRHNILHFQIPFKGVKGKTLINKMKLIRIKHIIINSRFTKEVVDEEYAISSKTLVLYPPVDTKHIKSKRKKEKIILYVGRFSRLTQSKRQDVLIEVFKKLYKNYPDWKLILAGGAEVGADSFFEKLKKDAKGFPIDIVESPDYKTLVDLYSRSSIFWSASGYKINEKKEPQKTEHFGITPVEAMSAQCVPILYSAGGHKEIIKNEKNGYLWEEKKCLACRTKKVIETPSLMRKIALRAQKDSLKYSYERFEKELLSLL